MLVPDFYDLQNIDLRYFILISIGNHMDECVIWEKNGFVL